MPSNDASRFMFSATQVFADVCGDAVRNPFDGKQFIQRGLTNFFDRSKMLE